MNECWACISLSVAIWLLCEREHGHGCREETHDEGAVLHYTYNRFSDLKSRRDRCDCAPTEEDAKRCFILPFDRMVNILTEPSRACRCCIQLLSLCQIATDEAELTSSKYCTTMSIKSSLSGT